MQGAPQAQRPQAGQKGVSTRVTREPVRRSRGARGLVAWPSCIGSLGGICSQEAGEWVVLEQGAQQELAQRGRSSPPCLLASRGGGGDREA